MLIVPYQILVIKEAANNVNDGVPRTTVNRETTGTLLINEACLGDSRRCSFIHFNITITGNNPKPSSFSFTNSAVAN